MQFIGTPWVMTIAVMMMACAMSFGADDWLKLSGGAVTVTVDDDLALTVNNGAGSQLWQTQASSKPRMHVKVGGASVALALADAGARQAEPFDDGTHRGQRIVLSDFADTDVVVELVLAISSNDELLVQVAQSGGEDVVQEIDGLYHWQLDPAADAYTVVPRGGGYLIRSAGDQPATLDGLIGAAWSMPLFGMVRGDQTCYQIVESWWDAEVSVTHAPGSGTTLALNWAASHGKLDYARRLLVRFAANVDHVGMAKAYRQYLIERGEFKTLTERIETLPALKAYLAGVEYRWPMWKPEDVEHELANIRQFQAAGLPISFFFPKWIGYQDWQQILEPEPGPGGWPAANKLLDAVHEMGCTAKLMVIPIYYRKDKASYDPAKATGGKFPAISSHHVLDATRQMLDRMAEKGFDLDALYFDCNSAFRGYAEHSSPDGGPVSRRQNFEAQVACFRETRRRGIVPGAELARFWSVAEADFFFFTDWSSDRLRQGEPVPLFPLVFHDCFTAQFSGGGYYNEGKFDWYEDRNPRLYELMYTAKPSHNWLPDGSRAIEPEEWGTEKMATRLKWLKRWHDYYQAICYSEMIDHRFLNDERTLQRIEFANGVIAEFDLDKGMFRIEGVEGFSGDWEKPQVIERQDVRDQDVHNKGT
jgi:hypothetical protein